MKTLIMDTSFDYLVIAVAENNQLIYNQQLFCPKHQSEQIFVEIEKMQKKLDITPSDFSEIVVTKGPGSYTGVRIAMTIAKIFANLNKLDLYTISSLKAIIGVHDGLAIIDARAKRAYSLLVKDGIDVEETVHTIEELKLYKDNSIYGHSRLLGSIDDNIGDIAQNIIDIRHLWSYEEDIDKVIPIYLKDNNSYVS